MCLQSHKIGCADKTRFCRAGHNSGCVFTCTQRALCSEFNTLAVMYGKPSEEFITQKPPYIFTHGPILSPSGAG